ncbi:MAG TPA: hypothetical protein VMS55_22255 [Myxococcota bacterium]|nr:hypothetical protein [Myxococcota bacterium]
MQLKLLKCDWGMEHLGDPREFGELCGELGLDYVAMMFCDDEQAFRDQLERIQRTRPILINCHPGRDRYDFARGLAFFRNVMEVAAHGRAARRPLGGLPVDGRALPRAPGRAALSRVATARRVGPKSV